MKIVDVKALAIPDLKVIRFARFCDHRGYFTEPYRKSDIENHEETAFLQGVSFVQSNESFSRAGTIRGLHFQWNPFMGKLVRTVSGRMSDLALDIRKGSPTFGKVIVYDMPDDRDADFSEWIWVPPGFAHGNFFSTDTVIEYFCSGEYSPTCEGAVSPLASDLDWSLCDPMLQREFRELADGNAIITDKDRNGPSLEAWSNDSRADNFVFGRMAEELA